MLRNGELHRKESGIKDLESRILSAATDKDSSEQ